MESKSHILCIDDDDKIRELLEIFLHKHNFIVSTAKDAYEGHKISELFSFDLKMRAASSRASGAARTSLQP